MKKVLAFIACFAFFVSFAVSSEQEGSYSNSFARMSYVKGDVFIQRAEDLGYEEGVVNLPIVEGDKLGTREGRAEIHFGKRNYLRIDSFTQIDFVNLPRRGYDQIKLHLLSGNIFLRVSFLEEEKNFEIHTPDASFYILEEGLFRFEVRENRETELLVYEGAMEAAGEEGSLLVRSERKLIASSGYFSSDPVYFYASINDSFSRWNRARDALHARAITRRYLPAELYEYEVELAYNGRWVYERPYGYVWAPYVYTGWRPYHYGRWVWYPVIGWNWVSYDPWGWCVYHYGRWHWRLGLGWYWIPTRIWGPAWVHWYCGYNHIGWCPLSYYGYPVVIVNNIFYGRYHGRYYPTNSRALTVIRKDQLQAPRVSRAALSQNKLRKLGKISLSAKQPGTKPVIRRASLQNNVAAKVLSRSDVRSVRKGYVSGKTLSPSRSKSTRLKNSSPVLHRTGLAERSRSAAKKSTKISNSRLSSRSSARYQSKSSLRKSQSSRRISSSFSRSHRSKSTIKTYPSRKIPSLSRSREISSSSRKKGSFSTRRVSSDSGLASFTRSFSSKLKKKTYLRSGQSSRSFSSSFPSLRKRIKSSTRLRVPEASSTFRRSYSRKSYSSSRYRSSFSRSNLSRGTKISTSKKYSSRSSKCSSSRSRVSRSSSLRSSPRSSSQKNLRKK